MRQDKYCFQCYDNFPYLNTDNQGALCRNSCRILDEIFLPEVVFILDTPHQFLQYVLQGNETYDSAVVVQNDRLMDFFGLKVAELGINFFVGRNEVGWS